MYLTDYTHYSTESEHKYTSSTIVKLKKKNNKYLSFTKIKMTANSQNIQIIQVCEEKIKTQREHTKQIHEYSANGIKNKEFVIAVVDERLYDADK